jgi:hypothetical protein
MVVVMPEPYPDTRARITVSNTMLPIDCRMFTDLVIVGVNRLEENGWYTT